MWVVRCHWKAACRAKGSRTDPKRLDELLKDPDPKQVLSSDGLLGDLKNALAERILDVEMDVHLESTALRGLRRENHRFVRARHDNTGYSASRRRTVWHRGIGKPGLGGDRCGGLRFDALRVKLRAEGVVRNKAVYLAIGLCCSGHKASLGLGLEQTRGATFWLKVMNALKQRGTQGHPGGGR